MSKGFGLAFNNQKMFAAMLQCVMVLSFAACKNSEKGVKEVSIAVADTTMFIPPDTSTIPHDKFGDMVRYGRELIMNTAYYIGPDGIAGKYLGNKMNCNNCHLEAGTKPFGYNFFSTHARYPQYRGREDRVLTLGERINNCVERPHNGKPLPLDSKEIVAMVSYMKWLGANVPVGHHVKGDESIELEIPDRVADPQKGAVVYATICSSCHGNNGEGKWNTDSTTYTYPPLWGAYSFQKGSSPSRVLKIAAFIKANMPDKIANWKKPVLTDEQAIDVAAFINDDSIHPRPGKKDKSIPDYPDIRSKAIDYDMGPYQDSFTALQHKYGPFKPIIKYYKEHKYAIAY